MTATLGAQGAPLPDALKSQFNPLHVGADIVHPSTNVADADRIFALATYDTTAKTVRLEWRFCAQDAAPGEDVDEETVSYQPTAFCLRGAIGPTFYVAGYIQRTGHVIVEEWKVTNLALGVTQPVGGGKPKSTLAKAITRRVVLLTTSVKPIKAMVFNKPQNRLWLFENDSPNVVWRLDPDDEAALPEWYFDSTIIPEVAAARHAHSFLIKNTAPDGGGFVVILYPWPVWDPDWAYPGNITGSEQLYLFRDQNLDGTIDESTIMTWEVQVSTKHYFDFMDGTYH